MSSPRSVRQLFDSFREHTRGSQPRAKVPSEIHLRDESPAELPSTSGRSAREVLRLYYEAMKARSADALADLYAPDAVHEFPFAIPSKPSRYDGREAVRAGYRWGWERHPLEIETIEDVFVHEGADPEIVMGQWQAVGIMPAPRRAVALTGVLVLRVRDGLIVHARAFVDGEGVAIAHGRGQFSPVTLPSQ